MDLIASTGHEELVLQDYATLQQFGIRTVRDGIRWHRIEQTPGRYSFEADLPLVRAAQQTGTQVIWDLCHYGWPEDLSPFQPHFGRRLAAMSQAFVRLLIEEGQDPPLVVPINEISFLAWMGGTKGRFPPFETGRGDELKRCLVQATIECIEGIWEVAPQTRICLIDPLINVIGRLSSLEARRRAEDYRQAQFAAWDMIAGRLAPELGGKPEYLDVLGVNYYVHNQWVNGENGEFIRVLRPSDPGYRPLSDLLAEFHARYRRPLFIAETGIEGRRRGGWLRDVSDQVCLALRAGVPVEGICLYPIVDYPGWVDDRRCPTGLLGYPDRRGRRPVCRSLADELLRQQTRFRHRRDLCAGRGC